MIPINPNAPFFTDDEFDALVAALSFFLEAPLPAGIPKKTQRAARRAARELLAQLDGNGSFHASPFGLMVMADAAEIFESTLEQAATLELPPAEMERHRPFLPALRQKIQARLSASADM